METWLLVIIIIAAILALGLIVTLISPPGRKYLAMRKM